MVQVYTWCYRVNRVSFADYRAVRQSEHDDGASVGAQVQHQPRAGPERQLGLVDAAVDAHVDAGAALQRVRHHRLVRGHCLHRSLGRVLGFHRLQFDLVSLILLGSLVNDYVIENIR